MQSQVNEYLTVNYNCQDPAVHAANKLQEFLAADLPTLFFSAGGSSLNILPELSDDLSWANITVTVLDERATDDYSNRNFSQLRRLEGFKKDKANKRFINPLVDSASTPAIAGKKFSQAIREWLRNNPDGQVVATVGVGVDGHIAGMLPTSESTFADRFQGDSLAVGYSDQGLKNKFKNRITTTEAFFTDVLDQAIVYAAGTAKCSILQQLVTEQASIHKRPAELLKRLPAQLFTDCSLRVG